MTPVTALYGTRYTVERRGPQHDDLDICVVRGRSDIELYGYAASLALGIAPTEGLFVKGRDYKNLEDCRGRHLVIVRRVTEASPLQVATNQAAHKVTLAQELPTTAQGFPPIDTSIKEQDEQNLREFMGPDFDAALERAKLIAGVPPPMIDPEDPRSYPRYGEESAAKKTAREFFRDMEVSYQELQDVRAYVANAADNNRWGSLCSRFMELQHNALPLMYDAGFIDASTNPTAVLTEFAKKHSRLRHVLKCHKHDIEQLKADFFSNMSKK